MLNREEKTLRSDFLVHWTGKDINRYYDTLTDSQREEYVVRLRDTLLPSGPNADDSEKTNGLWMTRREEVIYEKPGVNQRLATTLDFASTCFTEVKLSLTRRHTEQYGCLGFGFSRSFVLDRNGLPVFYIDRYSEEGGVVQQFIRQLIAIDALYNVLTEEGLENVLSDALRKAFPEGQVKNALEKVIDNDGIARMVRDDLMRTIEKRLLSQVHSHKYWELLGPTIRSYLEKYICGRFGKNDGVFFGLLNSVANNMLFLKPMSDCKHPRDYAFLDEAEWRIVMPFSKSNPRFYYPTKEPPAAKIWFRPTDLEVLIFPDPETREKAMKCDRVFKWFGRKFPIMATVEECLNF